MLKNKIAISKNFLIAVCFISLVLFAVNNVSAMDLNESGNYDKISLEDNGNYNINAIDEDKLGNSQENTLLQAKQMSLNGGKFSDIQNLIYYNLSDGDTIILDGEFKSDGANAHIIVYKNITFKSTSKATLDARNLSSIFVVERGGSGSSFSNLILKNGNSNYGGAMWIYGKDVTIDNCEFEANFASKGGGAIYTHYDVNISSDEGRNLLIKNSKFKSNFACIAAGAVGAYGYNTRILNCSFQSNSVYNKNGGMVYGGAIQVGKEDFTSKALIKDCRFLNNNAISVTRTGLSHGGAACLRGGVTYENCLFERNSADFGGALTAHQSGTIKDCSFVYNSANDYGGAIANGHDETSINLNIIGCSFGYNNAPYGAAARLAGYDVVIEDSNFTTNIASIDGGAVYIKTKTLSIYDSNFKNNLAYNNGGAVYVNGESTTVQGSTFSGNMAIADHNVTDDGLGGAIYINGSSDNIRNNVFEYNVARNGSAIYYDNAGKDLTVTNNVMTQNQAWVYALPIYAKNIYYGDEEKVWAVIYGGNNIADYNNLAVSNAIYNAALNRYIKVNGETPVSGATNSGELYQDSREYNIDVLLTVRHSDGTVVYNNTLKSSYLGEVSAVLNNLKPGTYTVTATHYEDYYYKAITNQTTFVVTPKIDVAVSKSTTASQFNYQDSVVWTLSVTNYGPNDATGVKVNDALPAGLVYKSAVTSVGRYSDGVWNIGNLAKGASATLKITTLINKTGDITNNANVVSNEFDWNDTNNKDSEKITVNRAADLQITKTSNVTNPKYGDLVKWTITVKNNGPDRATNVEVADILPSGLILKNSPSNNQSGKWSVGTLNVGQSKSLEIITLVNKTGTIKNVASVNGSEYDPILSNNKDDASVTVAKAADIGVSKSVNNTAPNFGDLVVWTVVVVNNGPDAASGVKVSDVLPAGLVYRSAVASVGSYSGGVWSVGGLAKGASATLKVTTLVNKTGSIKNSVSVTGNEYDYNPFNDNVDKSINVKNSADLAVTKSVNNTAPNYRDLVKWTIVVKNNGPDAASGVKVSDVLPAGLVYRSAVASVGRYSDGVWNIGNLAKGASATFNIVTLVNKTGAVKNFASVSGNEYDYDSSNNNDDASVTVAKSADLAVSKSVNNTSPNYLDLVKWTIIVRNNGPDIAHNVVVGDVLPSGLVLKSSTGNYVDGKWSIDSLASGNSVSFEVVVMVNKTGLFVNRVSVSADEYDYEPSNNNASSIINVVKSADLAVSKSVNNTAPNYRDLVKWTIIVRNNGPDGATGVKVSDNLPDGLVFKSYTASVGTYSNGIWIIGNLAKDVSVRLDIVCMVNKTGSIVNYVNVTGNEYDINKNNNVANKSINVAKSTDLEIIKSVNNSKPRYHDLVKWTLTVRNNGPDNATDVVVKDMIPEGLIIQNAGVDYIDGKWFIGELNAFSSKTLEIITYVNKTGLFMNVATVSGYEYDYNKFNNQDNESVDVAPATDLEITKIVSNPNPDYLDNLKWILVVKNNGPDRATGVKISEVLAQAFELKSATTVKGYYINDVWSIGDLESGEIASLEIITKVVKTGNFTNAVNVTGNEYDYDESNNKANKSIIVNPAIDLEISKNVNITSPNYNDLVKWSITVRNNGPDKANNVEIVDLLSKGLEFVSYTSTKGHYDDGYWKFCCLESGESAKLDIISRVKAICEIENMAMANATEYDYNPENNNDESLINVAPASDMQVTKLVNQTNFNYKQLVEWTLIVRNNGPSDATSVVVIDTLPEGLTFISAQGDGRYTATGTWYVGNVSVGQSKELKIICRADDTGKFINVAVVKADQYDYDSANNMDEKSVDVKPAADLSITKTVSKMKYYVGDVVSYLIEITNNGPDMAKNINVSEIMDDSLVVESFIAEYGDFDIDNHVWHIDSLANGENTSLILNTVATKEGIIGNNVSVFADTFDYNLDNNYAEVIVEIITNIIDSKNLWGSGLYSGLDDYKVSASDFDNVVKATVEMKETGIPFALLIFVSLALLPFLNSNFSRKR